MLEFYSVIPVMVFDGNRLPSKKKKEKERSERRKYNYEKGISLLRQGKKTESDEYFRKAVDITPQMAFNLIEILKLKNIEYIVSPYESDSELAYLLKIGFIDLVITEDSDLIPFGAKKIFFKMDNFGNGEELNMEDISSNGILNSNLDVNFSGFTHSMIVRMCVISGSDYLDSLKGIGIKTSYKYVKKYKTFNKIFTKLKNERDDISNNYIVQAEKAENTFLFQRVWDPIENKLTTLNPLPYNLKNNPLDYIGPIVDNETIERICKAEIDPMTKQPFKPEFDYSKIKSRDFKEEYEEQAKKITSYFPIKKKEKINNSDQVYHPFKVPRTSQEKGSKKKKKKKKPKKLIKSKYFLDENELNEKETKFGEFSSENNFDTKSFKPISKKNSRIENRGKINRKIEKIGEKQKSDFSDSENDDNKFDYESFRDISPVKLKNHYIDSDENEISNQNEEKETQPSENFENTSESEISNRIKKETQWEFLFEKNEEEKKNEENYINKENSNIPKFNYGDFFGISPFDPKKDNLVQNEEGYVMEGTNLMNRFSEIGKENKNVNYFNEVDLAKEEFQNNVDFNFKEKNFEINENNEEENDFLKKKKKKNENINRKRKIKQVKITNFFQKNPKKRKIEKKIKKREIIEISDEESDEEENNITINDFFKY